MVGDTQLLVISKQQSDESNEYMNLPKEIMWCESNFEVVPIFL